MVVLLSLPPGPATGAGLEPLVAVQAPAAPRDATMPAPDSAVTTTPSVASAADTVSSGSIAAPASRESIAVAPPPRARRTLPEPRRFDRPRWVMLRSLLIPGWGQAHNGAWLKAVLVAGGDGALRVRFFRDEHRLNRLNREASAAAGDTTATGIEYRDALASGDPQRISTALAAYNGSIGAFNSAVFAYNALLEQSVNRRWLVGGVMLYALIDAYVDAHFKNFDINLQFDPALPGGTGTPGARLQIRWAF